MFEFELNIGKKKSDFLERLEKAGCVMNTIIFKAPYILDDLYAVSKKAAIEGMIHFYEKYNPHILSLLMNNKSSGKPLYSSIITGEPKGKLIDFYSFIGVENIVNNETVCLFGKVFDAYMSRFIYALLSPPYPMILKNTIFPEMEGNKKEYVLNKYLSVILGVKTAKDAERLVIYEWSDDWSVFFDEGKEWWGCYFWTVYNPVTKNIIVLGASTTD